MASSLDTTGLLLALRQGDRAALDQLVPRLYEELQRIARRQLHRHGRDGLLRTRGLVHEAYLKLVDQARVDVQDRAHFLAVAARAMRQVLVDQARKRQARKRGGGWTRISLSEASPATDVDVEELLEVDEAMRRLEGFDERLCRVAECRIFAGFTIKETAAALGLAPRTVDRAWQKARAWLFREIHEA